MKEKTTEDILKSEEQQLQSGVDGKNLTVGLMLKNARQAKKESIEKIADFLRIRAYYLRALEESEYKVFPGQAYALGFLRSYAGFLGLDVDKLVELYRKENPYLKTEEVNMPMPEQQSLFPSVKYLFFAASAIIFVWLVWYFVTYKETQVEEVPFVLTAQEPALSEEIIIGEKSEEAVDSAAEETPVVQKEVATPKTKAKKNAVQIVAREEVWVEIEQDDTLILSRTLKKGEKYDVPESNEELFLKTGNAGGLDVFVDGQKVKALGPVGAVRSGISLSADKLKKR